MSTPAVSYARVSTKEQEEQGYSVPAQQALLAAYAASKGFRIVESFTDSDTAKASGKRAGFARMLTYLKTHPTCRTVLVEKTDRLYRNLTDYQAIDVLKLDVHFVKEGNTVNPASHSSQKFHHRIMVVMAMNYVENLSEEIKKGMRQKAMEGGYPTHAPLGYQNTDTDCGIMPNPATAPIIKHLFTLASTGEHSARQLTLLARDLGLRSKRGLVLNKNTVCTSILRNPTYTGTFRWAGRTYEGKYEPLITRDLFDCVQRVLDGRRPPHARKRTFAYTGLLRCGTCGATMSGDEKKGRYVYYNCNGKQNCRKQYPERTIEATTQELLSRLHLPEEVADWLTTTLTAVLGETKPEEAGQRARLQARLTELDHLNRAAYEDKLLGTINPDFWTKQTTTWNDERDEIQRSLASLQSPRDTKALLRAAQEPLELLKTLPGEYVTRNPLEKRELLQTLVSNYTITEGTITVSMRSPFDLLRDGIETGDWWS